MIVVYSILIIVLATSHRRASPYVALQPLPEQSGLFDRVRLTDVITVTYFRPLFSPFKACLQTPTGSKGYTYFSDVVIVSYVRPCFFAL